MSFSSILLELKVKPSSALAADFDFFFFLFPVLSWLFFETSSELPRGPPRPGNSASSEGITGAGAGCLDFLYRSKKRKITNEPE